MSHATDHTTCHPLIVRFVHAQCIVESLQSRVCSISNADGVVSWCRRVLQVKTQGAIKISFEQFRQLLMLIAGEAKSGSTEWGYEQLVDIIIDKGAPDTSATTVRCQSTMARCQPHTVIDTFSLVCS